MVFRFAILYVHLFPSIVFDQYQPYYCLLKTVIVGDVLKGGSNYFLKQVCKPEVLTPSYTVLFHFFASLSLPSLTP